MKSSKKKIKVCFLIGSLKIGGAERHVVRLIQHLDRSAVSPFVAVFEKKGEFLPQIELMNVPIYEIGINKLYDLNAVIRLLLFRKYLDNKNIDIVHAFLWQANIYGAISGLFAKRKVIISKRNMNDWMTWPYIVVNRIANVLSNRITAVSKRVAESVKKREKIKESKIVVVPNGVCLPELPKPNIVKKMKKDLNICNATVLGVVASLAPRKGHSKFFEVVKKIIAKSYDIKVILIGDGKLKNDLEYLSSEMGINKHIIFLGYRTDVSILLDIIDIFVLPSFEEGMSNALMEAMAHGLPLVANNVGGNSENIEDGKSGFLTEPGDIESMTDCIVRLLEDEALRVSLGKNAKLRMEREFTMEKVAKNNYKIYQDVMEE